MKEIPELSFETIKRMEDMSWFTYAQIFDDLLVVAQKETSCYVWKTACGIVVIDGIWPDEQAYRAIIYAIKATGWENEKIAKFVITHGHIDHVGCGKWLVEKHNATTYLSMEDDKLRIGTPSESGRSDTWKQFDIDCYLDDEDVIDCGDKSITVVATPGHTLGCMSFVFPVFDNGIKHIASLFGGATAPWNDENGKRVQLESVKKFKKISKIHHVDVALTNHNAFDNGLERIAYSKVRMKYLPNIYILGEEGVNEFYDVFRKIAEIE